MLGESRETRSSTRFSIGQVVLDFISVIHVVTRARENKAKTMKH